METKTVTLLEITRRYEAVAADRDSLRYMTTSLPATVFTPDYQPTDVVILDHNLPIYEHIIMSVDGKVAGKIDEEYVALCPETDRIVRKIVDMKLRDAIMEDRGFRDILHRKALSQARHDYACRLEQAKEQLKEEQEKRDLEAFGSFWNRLRFVFGFGVMFEGRNRL